MKLLLDEMYSGMKQYLEILGWDVVTVQDAGLKGANDRNIIEFAKNNDLLLVTEDIKSANLAKFGGVKYVLIDLAEIAKITDTKIREKYVENKGAT